MGRFRVGLVPLAAMVAGLVFVASSVGAQVDGQLGGFGNPGGGSGQEGGGPVVTVSAQFTAPDAQGKSRLFVVATMASGWHIYSITQPRGGPIPSEIRLEKSNAYRLLGSFEASPPPKKHVEPLYDNLTLEEHHGSVVWHAPIELAPGVDPSGLRIEGSVYAMACREACIPPAEYPFTATLGPGVEIPELEGTDTQQMPAPTEKAAPKGAPETPRATKADRGDAHGLPWVRVKTFAEVNQLVQGRINLEELAENVRQEEAGQQRGKLLWAIGLILGGFAGGIVLNVMPCVLPVIGLKILSFVNQAGENRVRALTLNVAFSAGLISVFLLLAVLASGMNLQWGGQFQYPWFNVAMAVVIFAMGLSFLGVWEIPIPGFAGTGKAVEMAEREGLAGAFAKGVITTLLATPCTGPGMAFAVTMVMSEPPALIFAVFLAVGLGMASPYLLIGAFPKLIGFLPKPGAWMETFKQVMGFVLLGTTVWILSFTHWPYVVPTAGLMFGVWGACWWVQRKALAEPAKKAWAWIEAAVFVGLVWALMFPGVYPLTGVFRTMNNRWQHATAGARGATVAPGRYTLMIDFTADWCVNCQAMETTVLETEAVRWLVEENHVVPVEFDMTIAPEDEATKEFVQAVRVAQPSLAILPAGDPNRPATILRGTYGQGSVLDALNKAAPSIDRPR
jgi:suppressor for copper-sensitivity B